MNHLNVEIKARCNDLDRVRETLKSLSADFRGTDHQVDTYFKVNHGRLKLREGNIENYLIFYERSDQSGPKRSDVLLYEVTPGANLKEQLTRALGVLAVVDKRREIYFIGNVKFHLDEVQGLGTFAEIEAIDADGSLGLEKLQAQCAAYQSRLGIKEADLLTDSYSDQVLAQASK